MAENTYNRTDDGTFSWEDIGAGGYSAVNSALFGIPDIIVKAASSDAYQRLQALRERNKAASLVGDIAGAFAPTGGLLAKGIGTAAKLGARGLQAAKLAKAAGAVGRVAQAADTAGDIIRGTKAVKGLGGAIGRGALAGAEQVIPRLVTGEADVGDLGVSAGLGGALGGVGHGISTVVRRIPETVAALSKWADKTILKNADITNKVMRSQAAYAGDDLPRYMRELADFSEARQLHREPELDKLVAEVKENWKNMGKAFDASDFRIDAQRIVDAPDVAQAIRRDAGLIGKIDDIVTKTEATESFVGKRSFLNEILYDQSGKVSIDEKKIAKSLLDQIEGEAERLTGLDVGDMKKAWKMMKPFEAADILDDMRVSTGGLTGGSDTAFKLALGGLGAAGGASMSIQGVLDDPTNPEAWGKLAATTLGGSAAGLAKNQVGMLLARLVRKLPADKVAQIATDVAEGRLAKVLATIPKEDLPVAGAKFFTGKLRDDEPTEEVVTEAGTPESEVIEQIEEHPQAYMNALNERMMAYWSENFSDSMTFPEYTAAVKEATSGFDPRRTVNFFFSDRDERRDFLTDLEVAGKFKGVNVEELMRGPGFGEGILDPGTAAEKKLRRSEFVDTIARLVTSEGSLPSKTTKDTIQADIAAILALSASADEKKELILNKLEEKYGLGYSTLRQLGLA